MLREFGKNMPVMDFLSFPSPRRNTNIAKTVEGTGCQALSRIRTGGRGFAGPCLEPAWLRVHVVPQMGFEPIRISPPASQTGVSTKFHHRGE